MTDRKRFLNELRRLEEKVEEQANEILRLNEQLDRQGQEAFEMAGATMQIRQEDSERLAAFRRQNAQLVEFVESIADSKSKFRTKARKILGFC